MEDNISIFENSIFLRCLNQEDKREKTLQLYSPKSILLSQYTLLLAYENTKEDKVDDMHNFPPLYVNIHTK